MAGRTTGKLKKLPRLALSCTPASPTCVVVGPGVRLGGHPVEDVVEGHALCGARDGQLGLRPQQRGLGVLAALHRPLSLLGEPVHRLEALRVHHALPGPDPQPSVLTALPGQRHRTQGGLAHRLQQVVGPGQHRVHRRDPRVAQRHALEVDVDRASLPLLQRQTLHSIPAH